MKELPIDLKEKLDSFNGDSENMVSIIIYNYLKANDIVIAENDTALKAESIAFNNMVSPNITIITPEIIEYWKSRSTDTTSPLLRTRYADLVWDFQKDVTNTHPDVNLAFTVIDSNIAIAQNQLLKDKGKIIKKLNRALILALSINDKDRIKKVRDVIIEYEDRIAVDEFPGRWGFSFDFLIQNRMIPLSDEQENKIISDLESRLSRVTHVNYNKKFNPHVLENTALRLAHYYNKLYNKDKDDVKRVLKLYGDAIQKASASKDALVSVAWMKVVYSNYIKYGMKDEANVLKTLIRKLGIIRSEEAKPMTYNIECTKKEMKDYLDAMTKGTLEEVFNKVARHYLPNKNNMIEKIYSNAKIFVSQSLPRPEVLIIHGDLNNTA